MDTDKSEDVEDFHSSYLLHIFSSRNKNIDLFGSKPLGIFTDPSMLKDVPECTMWRTLNDRELKLSVTHPPANHFQQLIQWTEQGKLWRFPIDNEQGECLC